MAANNLGWCKCIHIGLASPCVVAIVECGAYCSFMHNINAELLSAAHDWQLALEGCKHKGIAKQGVNYSSPNMSAKTETSLLYGMHTDCKDVYKDVGCRLEIADWLSLQQHLQL